MKLNDVNIPNVRLTIERYTDTDKPKTVEVLAVEDRQWALAAIVRSEPKGPRTIQFGLALCQRTDVSAVIREVEATMRADLAEERPS